MKICIICFNWDIAYIQSNKWENGAWARGRRIQLVVRSYNESKIKARWKKDWHSMGNPKHTLRLRHQILPIIIKRPFSLVWCVFNRIWILIATTRFYKIYTDTHICPHFFLECMCKYNACDLQPPKSGFNKKLKVPIIKWMHWFYWKVNWLNLK